MRRSQSSLFDLERALFALEQPMFGPEPPMFGPEASLFGVNRGSGEYSCLVGRVKQKAIRGVNSEIGKSFLLSLEILYGRAKSTETSR